jgi:hypothetical protein
MADATLPVATPPPEAPQERTRTFLDEDGAHLQKVIDVATEVLMRLLPPRALQYARDQSDQMRVMIASANTLSVQASRPFHQDSGGQQATWYSATPQVTTMDAREQYEQQTRMEFQQQRARWSFT